MKQTWLDECERASIAASNMNLVSPRSVRTMTPALYQPPPMYAAGDYEIPLAGSNLPRPNKYELKRTLSTRSVGKIEGTNDQDQPTVSVLLWCTVYAKCIS